MAKTSSHRREKLESTIKDRLNVYLRNTFRDPDLKFVTITKVELTSDLAYASVYWDSFDSAIKQKASLAISKISGKVRSMLASSLDLRRVPEIKFKSDTEFEDSQNIDDLLKAEQERLDSDNHQ
jgi:ribosome-binding factor A